MTPHRHYSPHFTYGEFRGLDESVPSEHRADLRRLCSRFLEPLRERFGPVTVHSGHRSRAHNRAVGGAPNSYHLAVAHRIGAAADVSCARGTPREWFEQLDALGAPGLGLYRTHVHVDNRSGFARW